MYLQTLPRAVSSVRQGRLARTGRFLHRLQCVRIRANPLLVVVSVRFPSRGTQRLGAFAARHEFDRSPIVLRFVLRLLRASETHARLRLQNQIATVPPRTLAKLIDK